MANVTENGVVFCVENGVLKKMCNRHKVKCVKIPHILSNGEAIDSIKRAFCQGSYHSIEISDEIENIDGGAFEWSRVKRVRWSRGCKSIPSECFYCSTVEEIYNVNHVESIGDSAFAYSKIKRFAMPPLCTEIPEYCFRDSEITMILNTECIERVGKYALSGCDIMSFVWPSKCKIIPEACFENCELRRLFNIKDVETIKEDAFCCTHHLTKFTWPNNCETMPANCFRASGIKTVKNIESVSCVGSRAFANSDIEEILWPEKCPKIPDHCFNSSALKKFDFTNITNIGESAFADTFPVSKYDMSNSKVMNIDVCAFYGVDRENVIFSYYTPEQEVIDAL